MKEENTKIENIGSLWLSDGTTYSLELGSNLVGRLSGIYKNDVGIDTQDAYLGRQHFVIDVVINKFGYCDYIISDYKSKNGTSVIFAANNMKKVLTPSDKVYLKNGDIISAGKTIFKLRTLNKRIGEIQDNTADSSDKTQIV